MNKVDELAPLLKYDRIYREISLLCFTESWLNNNIPETHTAVDGFMSIRLDRDQEKTGKKTGGGVCVYVNDKWCHPGHITVEERLWDQDAELFSR